MEGDFVKEHILNLGKNILKAITQAIDTFLEFFLNVRFEKKEGLVLRLMAPEKSDEQLVDQHMGDHKIYF